MNRDSTQWRVKPSRLDTGEKGTLSFESSIFHLHDEMSEHEHGHISTSEDDLLKFVNLLEHFQTWTRFDKRGGTCRTTSSSGPMWEKVVARVMTNDKNWSHHES